MLYVHTSTSSPSSHTSPGPGNWPFIWIISRGCPFGLPTSHVNIKFSFTCLEYVVAANARRHRIKLQGPDCIVHEQLLVMDFQKHCHKLSGYSKTAHDNVRHRQCNTSRYSKHIERGVKQLRSVSGQHSGFASVDRQRTPRAAEQDMNISGDSPDIMSRFSRGLFHCE